MNGIEITLNGKKRIFAQQLNLLDLLKELNLNPEINIIEKNHVFVEQDAYRKTFIEHGDQVEVIRFIGGG